MNDFDFENAENAVRRIEASMKKIRIVDALRNAMHNKEFRAEIAEMLLTELRAAGDPSLDMVDQATANALALLTIRSIIEETIACAKETASPIGNDPTS